MAINIEQMRQGPAFRERRPLNIASTYEIAENIRGKIDETWTFVNRPSFGQSERKMGARKLFEITGEAEFSLVEDNSNSKFNQKSQPQFVQETALEVMRNDYGLDEKHFDRKFNEDYVDGTSTIIDIFPSQTHKWLSFKRVLDRLTNTGEIIYVAWYSVDESPAVKFKLPGFIKTIFSSKTADRNKCQEKPKT